MFDKASLKLGLDKALLQSMNTSQGGKDPNNKQLSKKEIEDLLKKGMQLKIILFLYNSCNMQTLKIIDDIRSGFHACKFVENVMF